MSSSSNATIITKEISNSTIGNKRSRGTYTKKCRRPKHDVHPGHKGVIQQQNKNWGSQIYFNNERIWLGTFKSEKEAGMPYDSAALKLRNGSGNGNFDRNFPWTDITIHELSFQRWFTKEAVLNMIRNGSYTSKLANYIQVQKRTEQEMQPLHSFVGGGGLVGKILFQKELTPSDVGRLNRLVIPKKAVLEFLPGGPVDEKSHGAEISELTFYDSSMRMWKFRYCYCKSSQTFVFTRGWNKFVSAHNLQTRDVLTFLLCQQPGNNINGPSVIYVIEVTHKNPVPISNHNDVEGSNGEVNDGVTVSPVSPAVSIGFSAVEGSNGNSFKEDMRGDDNESVERKKGFRLFGVQIF